MRVIRPLACAVVFTMGSACTAMPHLYRAREAPTTDRATPVARALDYIVQTQWREDGPTRLERQWAGNWPQSFNLRGVPLHFSEISPGLPAYIHYALCHVHEGTGGSLGLSDADVECAREARRRTASFLRRFRGRPGPLRAAFGWWPQGPGFRPTPLRRLLSAGVLAVARGPTLRGPLRPVLIPSMPAAMGIPHDADDTAYIHASLQWDQRLDGGAGPPAGLGAILARYRDTGPCRRPSCWIPYGSGVFLTWLKSTRDNNVDACVLANCVWALAMAHQTDTPGFRASLDLLRRAVHTGQHRYRDRVTQYYSSKFAFHALVARAFVEGPVPELAQSVRTLARDVERRARCGQWPGRTEATDTACAIVTLVAAERNRPLIARAARRLRALQDPRTGAWPDEPLVFGRSDRGSDVEWYGRAAVTSTAMAALIWARLGPVLRAN